MGTDSAGTAPGWASTLIEVVSGGSAGTAAPLIDGDETERASSIGDEANAEPEDDKRGLFRSDQHNGHTRHTHTPHATK